MKRFTETDKWRDPWFRGLTVKLKCLWSYLVDCCDSAGVIEIDYPDASHCIGEPILAQDVEFMVKAGRLKPLNEVSQNGHTDGKFWIPGFISYQQNHKLDPRLKAQSRVFACIQKHALLLPDEFYVDPPRNNGNTSQQSRQQTTELPTKEFAVSQATTSNIDPVFASYVYDDWSSRMGRDAGGNIVPWIHYVCKRWSRERDQWASGTHKGNLKNGGNTKTSIYALVKQKEALEQVIMAHPANSESASHNVKSTDAEKADLKLKRRRLNEVTQQIASADTGKI